MKTVKQVVIILFIFLELTPVVAQDYFYRSYSKALSKAKEQDKRLFIDFSATWCGPCKMMENKIFPDPAVRKFLDSNYVCLKFLSSQNRNLFRRYNIKSYPTFVILENTGQEVYRFTGYRPVENFLYALQKVPERNDLKEKYDSLYNYHKKDLAFLYKYYDILKKNKYNTCAEKISKKILKKADDWHTTKNMILILDNLNARSKYKRFYIKNREEFIDSLGEDMVFTKVSDYYWKNFAGKHYRWKYINTDEIKNEFKALYGDKYKIYLYQYFMNILEDKPEYKDIYQLSSILFIENADNLFKTNHYYNNILTLIFKLSSTEELKKLYRAVLHQFTFEDIALDYYDIKAFLEYKLKMEDEAIETIRDANIRSLKKYNTPFISGLKALIELDESLMRLKPAENSK